ncbi:MAG: hypothetical protein RLZZ584_3639 [Pseudomonadota bacterium]|jgi:hypothetical protein
MDTCIKTLTDAGLRLVANAALVRGREQLLERTGVDLAQPLGEAQLAQLRRYQAEAEAELLRLQIEHNQLALQETRALLAAMLDERRAAVPAVPPAQAAPPAPVAVAAPSAARLELPDHPWYIKAVQPGLATMIVLSTIVLFSLFVQWSGTRQGADGGVESMMNSTQKDIVIYILGVLSAAVTQVLGYYFGSSQSSANKSRTLDAALSKGAVEAKGG